MSYSQIRDQCPQSVEVACHNSVENSTISGPTEDVELFVKNLQDKGIFTRLVNVSNIAYHSRYIKPAAPLLLKYLQEVIPEPLPRSSKWISTSIPEDQWNTDLAKTSSAEYHTNNLLSPVLFEEGSKHIPKEALVIEIAPHGLLQTILRRSLAANVRNIPLTHKASKNGLSFLLAALGKLYLSGLDLDISVLYPKIEYPVGRGTKSLGSLVHWEHSERWRSSSEDKFTYLASVRNLDISLKDEEYRELVGHRLQNIVVIPTSAYLAIIHEILNRLKTVKADEVIFENLKFKNVVRVPNIGSVSLYIMVQKVTGYFEITLGNDFIGSGRVRTPQAEKLFIDTTKIEITENCVELTENDVYSEFYHRNHKYEGVYKCIKTLHLAKEVIRILYSVLGSVGVIKWNKWYNFIEAMIQQCLFQKGERNQNTMVVSLIQRIAVSLLDLPVEPNDLQVTYDYATGVVSSPGIQICGITVKPIESLGEESRSVSYNTMELRRLLKEKFHCIESGINLGLQTAVENFNRKPINNVIIVEIQTANKLLENNIKNVINKNPHLSLDLSVVQDPTDILTSQAQPIYVIINNVPDKDCINLVASSHVFLLAHTDSDALANSEITQVAEFFVGGISYSLLRKSANSTPLIVSIETDALTSTDLLRENLLWVTQLKSAVASAKEQRVYLVSTVIPVEGIHNFLRNASILAGMQNVRFVFILDKGFPKFNEKESVYKNIFKNDLTLTVIKDGCIGTYITTPFEFQNDTSNAFQTSRNIIDDARIDYLGINVKDETLTLTSERSLQLGNIDYSGITNWGERIMGLASLDLESCKLVPDPVLWWNIPGRCSLEDGATMPYAHVLAYYALIVVAKTKPEATVLVHGGCSAYGLATIVVARKLGCTVFTTVTSEKQKALLTKQFKFLSNHNVFNACNTSFEPQILIATGGVGADVVLNCLSGIMLNATLRCIAEFGNIVQVGKLDVEENTEIGMGIFLRNVSLTTVAPEDICNAPLDVKQEIQKLVSEGLKSVTVRPLYRTIFDCQNVKSILSTLKQPEHIGKAIIRLSNNVSLSQLNINRTSQFICDSKTLYLIYGGTEEMWVDVVEWLIFRGARKLAISSESKLRQLHVNRRLSLYQTYYDLEILFTPTKAHTRNGAFELLSEICSLGPLGAVFVLPNGNCHSENSEIKAVQYLDSALKTTAPKALFINFIDNAAGICHLRADAGFPTHNVQWEKCLEFSDVLYALDNILKFELKDTLIKDKQSKENTFESVQSLYKKLNLLLPSSISNLTEETKNALIIPNFISLPSLCAQTVREIPPVFIIPGMFNTSRVKDLASKLLYPAFCANFPKRMLALETIAALLANVSQNICQQSSLNDITMFYYLKEFK
ncbi:hypothetical protein ILUMI_00041, partial [Ignelater luminosus]